MKLKSRIIRGSYHVEVGYDEALDAMDTEAILSHLATSTTFVRELAQWISDNSEGGIEGFISYLQRMVSNASLSRENARLKVALTRITSMCGIPDAAEACHKIMKYADAVLLGGEEG
jgi:hypothetical protein